MAVAVVLVVALSACWQTRTAEPLQLAAQNEEIDATFERLERLGLTMDEELDAFDRVCADFFRVPHDTWSSPFPIDVFKYTAMTCLNAPTGGAPEPDVQEAATRLGVACAVPAAIHLESSLAAAPSVRSTALAKLAEVDAVRSERERLQSRLRQLPSILRRTRSYVATRRAEVRQMARDVQAREAELGRRGQEESLRRLEEYEQRLTDLELRTREIGDQSQVWSARLAEMIDVLYKDLSRLGSDDKGHKRTSN